MYGTKVWQSDLAPAKSPPIFFEQRENIEGDNNILQLYFCELCRSCRNPNVNNLVSDNLSVTFRAYVYLTMSAQLSPRLAA